MEKLFISAVLLLLVLFSTTSQADIQKCQDEYGRVYYYPDYEKLPGNCVITSVIVTPTEAERQALIREGERQARQEYREKVRATAKFLDDVEALRKK